MQFCSWLRREYLELGSRIVLLGLFGAAYGPVGLAWPCPRCCFGRRLVLYTWRKNDKTLAAQEHSLCGAVCRGTSLTPLLVFFYFDHFTGRLSKNSFVDPRAYYVCRGLEHLLLTIFIIARAMEMTTLNRGSPAFVIGAVVVALMGVLCGSVLHPAWKASQELRDLPRLGLFSSFSLSSSSSVSGSSQTRGGAGAMGDAEETLMTIYGRKGSQAHAVGEEVEIDGRGDGSSGVEDVNEELLSRQRSRLLQNNPQEEGRRLHERRHKCRCAAAPNRVVAGKFCYRDQGYVVSPLLGKPISWRRYRAARCSGETVGEAEPKQGL